ncbi:hypothetical protein [Moheibacter stercoris]|uniref:Uncharacterized protein n=1 Tax=Moheibacter stercoris TaxID=1628251 RepID=A0ABV2LVU9_9FLAO
MNYRAEANTENFKLKLEKQTGDSTPIWLFTPKVFNGKSFIGKIENSSFHLRLNSFFPPQKMISIKGNFKKETENKFLVEFSIGISRFAKIWNISVFFIAVFIFNYLTFVQESKFDWRVNFGILFIFLWAFFISKYFYRNAKAEFIQKLELTNVQKID